MREDDIAEGPGDPVPGLGVAVWTERSVDPEAVATISEDAEVPMIAAN